MVSLGATASGVNYATYTVSALAQGRTVTAVAHFFSAVIPALIGCGIGFFLVRTIKKSTRLAMRTLGFVGMLATTAFIEVYAQAATLSGFKLGAAALPNIGFTAGVILTVVFTYDPDKVGSKGSRSKLSIRLVAGAPRSRSRRRASRRPERSARRAGAPVIRAACVASVHAEAVRRPSVPRPVSHRHAERERRAGIPTEGIRLRQ
jgi:hypothetical protein